MIYFLKMIFQKYVCGVFRAIMNPINTTSGSFITFRTPDLTFSSLSVTASSHLTQFHLKQLTGSSDPCHLGTGWGEGVLLKLALW